MAGKTKAGTNLSLPVTFDDENFAMIEAIEFVFAQTEGGDTLKDAYWSRDSESRDCVRERETNVILVSFSREDTYKFRQNAPFYMDTRIHYEGSIENPPTQIVTLTMNKTLFKEGQEVGP